MTDCDPRRRKSTVVLGSLLQRRRESVCDSLRCQGLLSHRATPSRRTASVTVWSTSDMYWSISLVLINVWSATIVIKYEVILWKLSKIRKGSCHIKRGGEWVDICTSGERPLTHAISASTPSLLAGPKAAKQTRHERRWVWQPDPITTTPPVNKTKNPQLIRHFYHHQLAGYEQIMRPISAMIDQIQRTTRKSTIYE